MSQDQAVQGDEYYVKKLVWRNILFFGITSALALFALPLYAFFFGLSWVDWAIFFFMCFATMMATTLGYHRLFAHRAFKAHPVVVFLCLFFGAGTFGGPVLAWASQHRSHHRFTDTERDPYNIKKGFWHAHMGWFLFHRYKTDFSNVQDLSSDKWIRHQYDHYLWWAITTGIALPLLVGLMAGSLWGAFFLGVCGRLFFIHQSIFFINSACHYLGKATYSLDLSAKDSWICAFLTHGEGFHSYHHRFPSDYRNGVRWYQWDPTKWLVRTLSWFRFTWDLNRAHELQRVAAKSEVERKKVFLFFDGVDWSLHPRVREVLDRATELYEIMKAKLGAWEMRAQEYARLYREFRDRSSQVLKAKAEQIKHARWEFFQIRKEWRRLVRRYSVAL